MKNFDSNLDRIRSDSRHSRPEILGSPKRDASAAAPGRVSGAGAEKRKTKSELRIRQIGPIAQMTSSVQ
jgi:hypothetical protein